MESKGVEVVAIEYCPWGPTSTVDQLTRIRDAKPDFMFDSQTPDMIKVSLTDKKRIGMGEIPQLNAGYSTMLITQLVSPEAFDGLLICLDFAQWPEPNHPGYQFCTQLYQKERNVKDLPPDVYPPCVASCMVWEEAIRLAVANVGYENLNGAAVYDGYTQIKDFPLMDLTKPVTLTKDIPRGNPWCRMWRLNKDGTATLVDDWRAAPWILKLQAEGG